MRNIRKSCIIVLVLAVFFLASPAGAEESLPKNLKGVSGQVRGVVVEKGEQPGDFTTKSTEECPL